LELAEGASTDETFVVAERLLGAVYCLARGPNARKAALEAGGLEAALRALLDRERARARDGARHLSYQARCCLDALLGVAAPNGGDAGDDAAPAAGAPLVVRSVEDAFPGADDVVFPAAASLGPVVEAPAAAADDDDDEGPVSFAAFARLTRRAEAARAAEPPPAAPAAAPPRRKKPRAKKPRDLAVVARLAAAREAVRREREDFDESPVVTFAAFASLKKAADAKKQERDDDDATEARPVTFACFQQVTENRDARLADEAAAATAARHDESSSSDDEPPAKPNFRSLARLAAAQAAAGEDAARAAAPPPSPERPPAEAPAPPMLVEDVRPRHPRLRYEHFLEPFYLASVAKRPPTVAGRVRALEDLP